MSPRARLLTLFAGATALAGLTYGFGRLALRQRASVAPAAQRASLSPVVRRVAPPAAWESALVAQSDSSDALDLALDLDGVFDSPAEELSAITARPSDRVPAASGGDDDDPPSPDDLGRAWLYQATQSEHSFTEADLSVELEDLAALDDDSNEASATEPSEDDERESYG